MKKSKLKDCFGEETMIKYAFGKPVAKDLVEKLQKKYPVELFYEFPKPFFRVNLAGKFLLTGVIGLTEIKVTYRKNCPLEEQQRLENIFETI